MKISIVVATYNGEKYLSEQLNSFIKQSILPDEIVISDDNSMDNTIKIAKEFAANCSCMVKIIKNEKNHGVTGNFENAAKHATGDIVFLVIKMMFGMIIKLKKCYSVLKNILVALVFFVMQIVLILT